MAGTGSRYTPRQLGTIFNDRAVVSKETVQPTIVMMTVHVDNGNYYVNGVQLPTTSTTQLVDGQSVPVLIENGQPVAILGHDARRTGGETLLPIVGGGVEELLLSATTNGDLYFRDSKQLTKILEAKNFPGDHMALARWGEDGRHIAVLWQSGKMRVFRLLRTGSGPAAPAVPFARAIAVGTAQALSDIDFPIQSISGGSHGVGSNHHFIVQLTGFNTVTNANGMLSGFPIWSVSTQASAKAIDQTFSVTLNLKDTTNFGPTFFTWGTHNVGGQISDLSVSVTGNLIALLTLSINTLAGVHTVESGSRLFGCQMVPFTETRENEGWTIGETHAYLVDLTAKTVLWSTAKPGASVSQTVGIGGMPGFVVDFNNIYPMLIYTNGACYSGFCADPPHEPETRVSCYQEAFACGFSFRGGNRMYGEFIIDLGPMGLMENANSLWDTSRSYSPVNFSTTSFTSQDVIFDNVTMPAPLTLCIGTYPPGDQGPELPNGCGVAETVTVYNSHRTGVTALRSVTLLKYSSTPAKRRLLVHVAFTTSAAIDNDPAVTEERFHLIDGENKILAEATYPANAAITYRGAQDVALIEARFGVPAARKGLQRLEPGRPVATLVASNLTGGIDTAVPAFLTEYVPWPVNPNAVYAAAEKHHKFLSYTPAAFAKGTEQASLSGYKTLKGTVPATYILQAVRSLESQDFLSKTRAR